MIQIGDLSCRTLDIPDLIIPPGSTALIGPNGSGKTTLLRLLAGLISPDRGTITIGGSVPGSCRVGFVNEYPDRNALFSRVADEIAAPLRFARFPCAEVCRKAEACAEDAGLSHLINRRLHTLSGGEKSLVALLAATINQPDVLILDEFDSHLDEQTLDAAEQVIRASGPGYIVRCTQNMDVAGRSGTVIALFDGRIRVSGRPEEVFSRLADTCYVPFGWGVQR